MFHFTFFLIWVTAACREKNFFHKQPCLGTKNRNTWLQSLLQTRNAWFLVVLKTKSVRGSKNQTNQTTCSYTQIRLTKAPNKQNLKRPRQETLNTPKTNINNAIKTSNSQLNTKKKTPKPKKKHQTPEKEKKTKNL